MTTFFEIVLVPSQPERSRSEARDQSALAPSEAELHTEISDDSASNSVDRGLDAVLDLELHQDVRDVVLDRLRADVERLCDLRVVLSVRDQAQDLELAVGELRA